MNEKEKENLRELMSYAIHAILDVARIGIKYGSWPQGYILENAENRCNQLRKAAKGLKLL